MRGFHQVTHAPINLGSRGLEGRDRTPKTHQLARALLLFPQGPCAGRMSCRERLANFEFHGHNLSPAVSQPCTTSLSLLRMAILRSTRPSSVRYQHWNHLLQVWNGCRRAVIGSTPTLRTLRVLFSPVLARVGFCSLSAFVQFQQVNSGNN